MERILIIGTDSVAARALGDASSAAFEVTALTATGTSGSPLLTAHRLSPTSLKSVDADTLVFCGGASRSSWDPEFGDFTIEEQWLQAALQKAAAAGAKFVYISSDAVFGGPWVFHNDDSTSFAETKSGRAIRQFEHQVEALRDSLIVRTNVVGLQDDESGIAKRILDRLRQGESEVVDAGSYGTPIAVPDFALATMECLKAELTGSVNVSGAERTNVWRLATAMAKAGHYDCDHLVPGRGNTRPTERSLRCERLRRELKITTPTLQETAEHIVASTAAVVEPIAA